jgi:DNA helicase-2/ATP-dependent DNA helicase PcrA
MQVTPSSEQGAILHSQAPTLMIEARAGTGKTTTLALLAARAPGVVLGLCFSEGARLRLQQKLAEECPQRKVQVLTVEALARSQLTRLANSGSWLDLPQRLASAEQLRPHLVAAAQAVWQRYDAQGRATDFDFDFEYRTPRIEAMLQLLATLKATLAVLRFDDEEDCDDFALDEMAEQFQVDREAIEICRDFERRRQPQQGHYLWQSAADFAADLVCILRRHPQAAADMPQADLLLVDEWHDVNAAEFALLQLFRRQARLVVVGDRHQIINAARGADPRFSAHGFELAFPDAQRLTLSQSRRCGVSLKKVVERVLPRSGFESHPDTYSEVRRLTFDAAVPGARAAAVVARARALTAKGGEYKLSQLAIIVRDADQTVELENALLDQQVPYSCDGMPSYLLRAEILLLRALLHIASADFSTLVGDRDTCVSMVESLLLYLSVSGDVQYWDTEHEMYGSGDPLQQAKEEVAKDPATLAFLFSGVLCQAREFDSPTTLRWKQRFGQVVQLLQAQAPTSSAAQLLALASQALDLPAATRSAFVSRSRADSALRTIEAFTAFAAGFGAQPAAAFLQQLRLRQQQVQGKGATTAAKGGAAKRTVQQLLLTTVQAAKGREWPQVLLPWLDGEAAPGREDGGEEQRYRYVAVTRAIAGLSLFVPHTATPVAPPADAPAAS